MIKTAAAALVWGASIALAASPTAMASPTECQPADTVTVCEEPGSAAIATVPDTEPANGSGTQNGPYGPAGATPPVGN